MSETWNENAKYILNAIAALHRDQKELSTKIDNYQLQVLRQKDICNSQYVSRWFVGIIITILCFAGLGATMNSINIYDRINDNKIKIELLQSQDEEKQTHLPILLPIKKKQ